MDVDYWKQRWQHGDTGWHRDEVMPLLRSHWPALAADAGTQVLVPLCGKTLDMAWLAAQGHAVLGIEISAQAIGEFFATHGLHPEATAAADGIRHRAGDITLIEGDAFAIDAASLAQVRHVYDRAALIALPPALRQRYADTVYARLPAGTRGLLITLEYPQHEKHGPPFSVDESEVHRLFAPGWDVARLERRDILASQPGFIAEGVSRLQTVVYRLDKRIAAQAGLR